MRTIGVTAGASEPAFTIWARLSMYCSASRSARAVPRIVLHLEHDAVVFRRC